MIGFGPISNRPANSVKPGAGIEPAASSLPRTCSNRLSYPGTKCGMLHLNCMGSRIYTDYYYMKKWKFVNGL